MNEVLTAQLLDTLEAEGHKAGSQVKRAEVRRIAEEAGLPVPYWFDNDEFREDRGYYKVPTIEQCKRKGLGYPDGSRKSAPGTRKPTMVVPAAPSTPFVAAAVRESQTDGAREQIEQLFGTDVIAGDSDYVPTVPAKMSTYVPFGHFEDVTQIAATGVFMPFQVVGPSGDGKTVMIEQACAEAGREFVRINITTETDEDDLIGGFRLVEQNGTTVTKFALGPVPLAMIRGAMCLLDEVDLGGAKMLCLQPVLEGKPLYIKKINKYIMPSTGFNIATTSNTKGRGDDGRYMHTMVMNDAMLERFGIMFEQGWPDEKIERKILKLEFAQYGIEEDALANDLAKFAKATRDNYSQQVCNEQISTRRLLHIARIYVMFRDMHKALDLALARFDETTATGFKNLWTAIDSSNNP